MTASLNEHASAPTPGIDRPRSRALTLGAATLLYTLFVAIETLTPFHLALGAPDDLSSRLLRVTFSSIAWTDLVANTALFAPLGALLAARTRLRGWTTARSIMTALVLGTFFSLGIEVIQAFSPERVSSIVDVAANSLGTVLGIPCGLLLLRAHKTFKITWFDTLRRRPREARIAAVLTGLILFAGMPFALTFDVGRTSTALKNAKWTPFAEYHAPKLLQASETAASANPLAPLPILLRRERIEFALGDLAELASFAVLAFLLMSTFRADYGFRSSSAILLTAWVTGGLAVLFSAMQIFIIGRGWYSTDVLVRTAGGWAGAAARATWHARRRISAEANRDAGLPCTPGFARVAVWCIGAYILVCGLTPFAWRFPGDQSVSWTDAVTWTPFASYFRGRFDVAMHDLMTKAGSFLLLGCALTWARSSVRAPVPRARGAILATMALATAIEAAQCVIASRVVSVTDVLLAALGAWVGHELAAGWMRGCAVASDMLEMAPSTPASWTLTDALVGQLIEPTTDDAPGFVSRAPQRPRGELHGDEDPSPVNR